MRLFRAAPVAALALAAAAVAACGSSSDQAGWTYAPAPSVTPAASVAASAPASGEASAAPSAPASAAPSAPASGEASAPAGDTVTVVATSALRWDTPDLTAPADTPFTLEFDNRDPAAPHNVVIKNPDNTNVSTGDTSFFTGPEVRTYQVPALAAGEYQFLCEVHPTTMVGTLTVQ